MMINLVTGILFLVSAVALGGREIALSPSSSEFPCAPLSVRLAMMLGAAALLGLGALFIDQRRPYAGEAAGAVLVVAAVFTLYNCVLFLNVLSQRFDADTWRRLRRQEQKLYERRAHLVH